jgi:hypothetical protein
VFSTLEQAPSAVAASVVAVGLLLVVMGEARRPSGASDTIGFVLGVVWILWGLCNHLVWWLPIPWLLRSGIG